MFALGLARMSLELLQYKDLLESITPVLMVSYGRLILALRTWGFVGVEHHGVLRECNS